MTIFKQYRKSALCLLLVLLATMTASAQALSIQGMGLSGRANEMDSLAHSGDTLYAIISFEREPGIIVDGIALDGNNFNLARVHYYPGIRPEDVPTASVDEAVILSSVVVDTLVEPNIIRFQFQLLGSAPAGAHSFQFEARVYGHDPNLIQVFSDPHTSYLEVGDVLPVNDPVDEHHAAYLNYEDVFTDPPELISPQSGALLGRTFEVVFNLPEQADLNTLYLSFADIDSPGIEPERRAYLVDHSPGVHEVTLNASALNASPDVQFVNGINNLTHNGSYRLIVAYSDVDSNTAAGDTVYQLHVDIRTDQPDLIEPNQQTESETNDIRIYYQLPEPAQFVEFTFALDTLSPVPDPASPHVFRLISDFYDPGLHLIFLDGTNIGTNNPLILSNDNGAQDALQFAGVYNVTLTYGDTLGNAPATDVNHGYMYPRDLATLRPDLISPVPAGRENRTILTQFRLPEEAYPGTVQVIFSLFFALDPDPGAPHTLTFPSLIAPGAYGFELDALDFVSSDADVIVTGPGTPEQNNTLVHGLRYRVTVSYRDAHLNPAAADTLLLFFTFDVLTDPPELLTPVAGDSLSRLGTELRFNQPEYAIPGTLKLTFIQTGGPEFDLQSPHVLYLSNHSLGFEKTVLLQPLQLSESVGIDSVGHGGQLLPLSIYRMTLEYQDTLANPAASASIEDLYLPTGASVFVQGHSYSNQLVFPGGEGLVFMLGLRTEGGASVLRGLRYLNDGSLIPSDVNAAESKVWMSVDSVFDPQFDTPLATLSNWIGNDLIFSSFAVTITDLETYVFTTLRYNQSGDPAHTVNLMLMGPEAVDCGGDPVFAASWPIGEADVPLDLQLSEFFTEQPEEFGALRLIWRVASEVNNEGFNVLRRDPGEDEFHQVASFTNTPSLTGRGTDPTAWSYSYVDRNLTPGQTYVYRLEAVSSQGFVAVLLELEATGVPRLPPSDFVLNGAYPNPFNQDVTIEYVIPYSAVVELTIHDINGRLVRSLVRQLLAPSIYRTHWDSRDNSGFIVPSGVYFYRFRAGGTFDESRKLLLLR